MDSSYFNKANVKLLTTIRDEDARIKNQESRPGKIRLATGTKDILN